MARAPWPQVHVLGIRHHGPGSARSVAQALAQLRPDRVLVEGAPELDQVIESMGRADMVPPVAGVVHAVNDPRRSAFYPFAEFSPEWVAVRWALQHEVPVNFMDLPMALVLAAAEHGSEHPAPVQQSGPAQVRTDPLAVLAAAAGYAEPERWWEDAVEQRFDAPLDRFAGVSQAMAAVRETTPPEAENDLREAAMRQQIRAAARTMTPEQRLVVVCGAWHAPALEPAGFGPASHDAALLRGRPKVKVAAAWTPWTSERLAVGAGYGAGVQAPGWYRHLFRHGQQVDAARRALASLTDPGPAPECAPDPAPSPPEPPAGPGIPDVATTWLVRVARALRAERLDASTASVVEAARLAESLAALRGRPTPGLDELDEATVSVLTHGHWAPLQVVHRTLTVGQQMGRVPHDAPTVPLAADLAKQQKSLRLKVSPGDHEIQVDLRQPSHLAKSVLLHRLDVLGIPWAEALVTGQTSGTFKEAWRLQWQPESMIALVLANQYGSTVATAAAAALSERARLATGLGDLSELLALAMRSDLPVGPVLDRLAARAAEQHDAADLLRTIEPLARTCRYGDVRGLPTDTVREVLEGTLRRALVGLPTACSPLAEEAAEQMRGAVESAQRGLEMLHEPELDRAWRATLAELADGDHQPGAVAGRAARVLLDSGTWDTAHAARVMSRRLSIARPPAHAVAWLESFLTGDATLLLHDDTLLRLLDQWLLQLPLEIFAQLLPLVRRSFAAFTPGDRHGLGRQVAQLADPTVLDADQDASHDLTRLATGLGATTRLLRGARLRENLP